MKRTSFKHRQRGTAARRDGGFRFDPHALVKAARQAVREALLQHKRSGNPVVVTKKGRIVVIPPDQIDV